MKLREIFDLLTPNCTQKKQMLEVILTQGETEKREKRIKYIPKPVFGIIALVLAVSASAVLFNAVKRGNEYIKPGESGFAESAELKTHGEEATVASLVEEAAPSIEPEWEDVDTETVKSEEYQSEAIPNNEETAEMPRGEAVLLMQMSVPIAAGEYHVSEEYESYNGHKGIDLAAERGTAIYAAADGVVSGAIFDDNDCESFWNGEYGNCIIIEHGNDISTLYAHCSEVLVSRGQEVKKGDLIARVGQTGLTVGNCLHFEVLIDGGHIDPREVVVFD